jgi:hypothetical protein
MRNKTLLKLTVKELESHKFHSSTNCSRHSVDQDSHLKKVSVDQTSEADVLTRIHLPKRKKIRNRRKKRKKKKKLRLNLNPKRKLRLKKSRFLLKIKKNQRKLLINALKNRESQVFKNYPSKTHHILKEFWKLISTDATNSHLKIPTFQKKDCSNCTFQIQTQFDDLL